jgi:hypothetical protein
MMPIERQLPLARPMTRESVMERKHDRRFHPEPQSVVNRGRACELAKGEPQRAFDIASTIPDGWYRCQAMAEIAEHAPEPLAAKAFAQARAAAAAGADDYQRAHVLAFAMIAALRRGRRDLANDMLADALAIAPSVEPMASRAYAMEGLWRVCRSLGDWTMQHAVLASVQALVHPDRSWRARQLYREIADDLAAHDPRRARAFVAAMPEGKARSHVERRLERRFGPGL